MKCYVGGVRGTTPVMDKAFTRYGGDTTSLLIEGSDNERIIIDAGTGLRNVAKRIEADPPESLTAMLLFTHFHFDHIAGLPSFAPLYDKRWTIELGARLLENRTAEEVIRSFMRPPFWPLTFDELMAGKRHRILNVQSMDKPILLGTIKIRWCPLHHPGGSTAFRFDDSGGGSIVFATDIEWNESTEEEKKRLTDLCSKPGPADVLIFDGKYAPAEYESFRGWGHSTWLEGVELAQACGVRECRITHHDPSLNDEACDRRDEELRTAWPAAGLLRQDSEIEC